MRVFLAIGEEEEQNIYKEGIEDLQEVKKKKRGRRRRLEEVRRRLVEEREKAKGLFQ